LGSPRPPPPPLCRSVGKTGLKLLENPQERQVEGEGTSQGRERVCRFTIPPLWSSSSRPVNPPSPFPDLLLLLPIILMMSFVLIVESPPDRKRKGHAATPATSSGFITSSLKLAGDDTGGYQDAYSPLAPPVLASSALLAVFSLFSLLDSSQICPFSFSDFDSPPSTSVRGSRSRSGADLTTSRKAKPVLKSAVAGSPGSPIFKPLDFSDDELDSPHHGLDPCRLPHSSF